MAILTIHDLKADKQEEHALKWGTYNDFPPGWTEITQEEFARSAFFTYGPELIEHRQMCKDERSIGVDATLMFIDGESGYSIVNHYWHKTVKFYKFGCTHEFKGDPNFKAEFRSQHGVKCVKCGYTMVLDSSD